jgi:hypothetical protein
MRNSVESSRVLVLLSLVLSLGTIVVNGTSPKTITIDGNISEWDSRDGSNGVTAVYGTNTWYFTWDSTNFYAALQDKNYLNDTGAIDANQIEIYIDTNSDDSGTSFI